MSAEFAKMLKDTLEKMQERIRLAEWDNDNDPSVIKKIKEMNNTNWCDLPTHLISYYFTVISHHKLVFLRGRSSYTYSGFFLKITKFSKMQSWIGINSSVASSALSPFPMRTGEVCVWKPVIFFGFPAWPTTSTACPTLMFSGIASSLSLSWINRYLRQRGTWGT